MTILKKTLKYYFIWLTIFICSTFSYGQNEIDLSTEVLTKVDSLKLALKNAKHDTTRCKILNELIESENDDTVWPVYNEQLLKLAQKCANESTKKILKEFYFRHLSDALNNIGFLARQQGDIPKALEFYHKSLKIQEEIMDKEGIANSLNNIGFIYNSQGDIPKALEFFHKSLKIREEISDKVGIASSLNNIGSIYEKQGDIPKGLEYYHKSLKIYEKIRDKYGIANLLNNIGVIYNNQGDIPKALEFYHKSLKIQEEIVDKEGIANSLNNIGFIYNNQAESPDNAVHRERLLNKALEFFHKSLKIREEIMDKNGIAYSLNNIGVVLLKQGKVTEAIVYATRSMGTAKELGFPKNIKYAASLLKDIYRKQNKFKEAFNMYELEIQMRDSINNQETRKASIKKQFQYDYEKKEAVANAEHKSELEKQQAVADEKNRKQKIVIWSVAIGLLLVIVFATFIFKTLNTTRKQKQLIEIKNIETEEQKKVIEEKQKDILDSIRYAKRIQTSLLPTEKYIGKVLNNKKKYN